MNYLGDYSDNASVVFAWDTSDASGAPATRDTNGTIYVERSNAPTGSGATVTKANPGVVTSTAHGLATGDEVFFYGLTEMTELNQTIQTVTYIDANSFSINDTSAYGAAETTGGSWVQVNTADVTDDADYKGVTGSHRCAVDMSADAYFATGADYTAYLLGAVIGTTTVNATLATWSCQGRYMRGTDAALLAASAPTNFGDLAITATTGKVTVGTNDDKTGYTASTVTDKTGYSISGTKTTLDALNDITAAAAADAVWDESTVGHTTAGTFGEQAATDIDAILADTADMQPKLGTPAADVAADIAAVKAQTAAIEADTQDVQARLPAALVGGRMDCVMGDAAHGGSAATLQLKSASVINNAGTALELKSSGGNGMGLDVAGNGNNRAATFTGGATGDGVLVQGGATAGRGVVIASQTTSRDVDGLQGMAAFGAGILGVLQGTVSATPTPSATTCGTGLTALANADQIKGRTIIWLTGNLAYAQAEILTSTTAGVITYAAMPAAPAAGDEWVIV